MRIAITGATGFIGRRLCDVARGKGHDVIALSRSGAGGRRWDPLSEPAPLEGAEAVVHLAAEPLSGGRWTQEKMTRIRDSRVIGTRHLLVGLQKARPRVLASASAVGYYGDRGEDELTEESKPGDNFLASVCNAWEEEAMASGIRTVILRAGTVLGPGGALQRMVEKGWGRCLGAGRQWMSWIHRDDLVELYLYSLTREDWSGPVLATSPIPVRNEEFTWTLAWVLDRPAAFGWPRWGMRLAFGKAASALATSQRCRPTKALGAGFPFSYPTLEPALRGSILALQGQKAAAA